jgi:ABC-type lipoprotein release transport system permease subunit
VLSSLRDEPLSVAPLLALLGAAALALLLTGLGFLASVAAPRERGRDLAVLDALGATPGQLTRLLCLEQALLSVPAAAGGLVLGLFLTRLIVPAVTLTSGASQPVPSVLVEVPMLPVLLVAVAVAAFPVVAAGISILRGTATVARLRAEEEA